MRNGPPVVHAHCGATFRATGAVTIATCAIPWPASLVGGHPARSYAWSINRTTRAQSCTLIGGAAYERVEHLANLPVLQPTKLEFVTISRQGGIR